MVKLFSLHRSKLELQTYGRQYTRNFLYHVLAFRTLLKFMTPREKASELIINYQLQCKSLDYKQAKQCALIAVEEILKCEATEPTDTDWDDCGSTAQYYWPQKKEDAGKFWGEVKSELLSF